MVLCSDAPVGRRYAARRAGAIASARRVMRGASYTPVDASADETSTTDPGVIVSNTC